MRVYQCEDSMEGIFTAIYNIYEDKCDRRDTRISLNDELFLFAEYIPVEVDENKAIKVMNTLRQRFGEEDYMRLCMALASPDPEKAHALYQTVALGLAMDCKQGHLLDNLANDYVNLTFSLARGANNEYLHLRGFVRFSELDSGILFSRITPKNNILTFLMPHFEDRFPMENFIIYDEGRKLFGVHPAGEDWYLIRDENLRIEEGGLKLSDKELEYQELFRHFCHTIAIKERKNPDLQRNMLPLRFRGNMVEFVN